MPVLNIRTAEMPGGETLTVVAREVTEEEFGPELDAFMTSMLETMYTHNGVGLAAPQVGDSRRFIVLDGGQEAFSEYSTTSYKMVNPVIVESSDEREVNQEGCLSVPNLYVDVERATSIKVRYQTPAGDTVVEDFDGFMAIKIQHELDHLDGTTLLKHASRLKRSRYQRKMKKILKRIMERHNVNR